MPADSGVHNGAAEAQARLASRDYMAMLRAMLDVTSARAQCLLALIASIGMFGYAVFDPAPNRIAAAVLFNSLAMWPLVWAAVKSR